MHCISSTPHKVRASLAAFLPTAAGSLCWSAV